MQVTCSFRQTPVTLRHRNAPERPAGASEGTNSLNNEAEPTIQWAVIANSVHGKTKGFASLYVLRKALVAKRSYINCRVDVGDTSFTVFLQMVWYSSHKVGCGFHYCGQDVVNKPFYNYVCNYCPM
ncbi:hypothetical protein HPB48_003668 [Haemaphysalis longicornis]|uniref:SCP domain-containing protein n=1 Tax=Haemaphysalis longicornis TaxID=44386 RepID=A0A9J6FFZ5_HAELO|nr:hypothetical protein HPB48_003668 [Haemaphysalis longicornis]